MCAARSEQAHEEERPAAAKADGQDDDKEMVEAASQQVQPGGTCETARAELAMAEPADHRKLEAGMTPEPPGLGAADAVHQVDGPEPEQRGDAGTASQVGPNSAQSEATPPAGRGVDQTGDGRGGGQTGNGRGGPGGGHAGGGHAGGDRGGGQADGRQAGGAAGQGTQRQRVGMMMHGVSRGRGAAQLQSQVVIDMGATCHCVPLHASHSAGGG